jgi:pantothenate kinase
VAFNSEQDRQFERLTDFLHAHGYFVAAEPIEGMEEVFLGDILDATIKIEREAERLRRRYRYRGRSQRLLRELAISLPAPSFNVESFVAAEIRAEENRRRA